MGWASRRLAPAFGLLAFVALLGAPMALARPRSPQPPPKPPSGWVVDRARFEPVDPAAPLSDEGDGDYHGALEVAPSGGGVTVVNDVPMDDYLRGISEVPPEWPGEALKAQVVAARSYAMWMMAANTPAPWRAAGAQICATDSCQVYRGLKRERQPDADRWNAAVAATAGQVLLYNGAPIFAEYSASNGGRSAAGSYPYLRSVADPDDRVCPESHWRYNVPLSALAPLFGVNPPFMLVGVAKGGGDATLIVRGPDNNTIQQPVPADQFTAKIASLPTPPGLPSTLPTNKFTVGTQGDQAVVDGEGHGHGVGMSQCGALGKAQRGMRAPDILAAYYGGIRPTQGPVPPRIKVAVNTDKSSVTITGPGRFRVTDGAGHPLAVLALGRFQVVPASGNKVRIVPPTGYDQPVALTPSGVDPADPPAGAAASLHFKLSVPAIVKLSVQAPGAPPVVLEPRVVDAGDGVAELPPAPAAGDYRVTIEADAGPGRQASVPTSFRVAGPSRLDIPPAAVLAMPDSAPLAMVTTALHTFPSRTPLAIAADLVVFDLGAVGVVALRRRRLS